MCTQFPSLLPPPPSSRSLTGSGSQSLSLARQPAKNTVTYPTLSLSLQVTHCWLSRHFTIHHSVIFFASHNARLRPRPLRIGLASPHSSSQIRSVGNSARQCPTTLSPLLALELSRVPPSSA
ncbi:hypothetical protein KJ359_007128 [Pestalotiopsis sp. 9143b]|nr:hypothetical protein KJ359_007128 [Pestalotiopsis sp. 9143b]